MSTHSHLVRLPRERGRCGDIGQVLPQAALEERLGNMFSPGEIVGAAVRFLRRSRVARPQ